MGTNYYVKSETCECCGHKPEQLHIGKSSAGWTFSFHATETLQSFKDWKEYLKGQEIVDEYDRTVTLQEFCTLVEAKADAALNHAVYCLDTYPDMRKFMYLDPEGHSFSWREFS